MSSVTMNSSSFCRYAICRVLILMVVGVTGCQDNNKNELINAARKGDLIEMQYIIEKRGVDVNTADQIGWTALHMTVGNPNVKFPLSVLKYLIDNGADVNANGYQGYRPLHNAVLYAAESNSTDEIQFLIDAGADVNAKNDMDETPLFMAAQVNPKIAKYLMEHGADVNVISERGWTPLHRAAAYYADAEVLHDLIEHGAVVNVKDNEGKTPLDIANRPEKVEILREAGGKSGKEL